jgi:hypothetical protein
VFKCLGKKRNCFVEYHDENYFQVEEAPLEDVEAVYSASEESDGQVSDHVPTNAECSSSSADFYELEDTTYRDGFVIDEYKDFKKLICVLFVCPCAFLLESAGTFHSGDRRRI